MSRRKAYIIGGSVIVAIALALALAACSGGTPASQTPTPVSTPTDSAATAPVPQAPEPAPPGGPAEGINVHGQWTIEVREPDGTLVSRTEFENALVGSGGDRIIAEVLGRKKTMGIWFINLGGGDLPCYSTEIGAYSGCYIIEPSSSKTDSTYFKNLTVTVPTTGSDIYKIVLSGNYTAPRNYSLREVYTGAYVCAPTVAPSSNCETLGYGTWVTGHTLASSVPVVEGQQVLITVKLSFS